LQFIGPILFYTVLGFTLFVVSQMASSFSEVTVALISFFSNTCYAKAPWCFLFVYKNWDAISTKTIDFLYEKYIYLLLTTYDGRGTPN